MHVDLHAPTIKGDQRVWRMFPGHGYQFLPSFLSQQVGYLDFPDLRLPDDLANATDLIPRIARSQDVRKELLKEGADFNPGALRLARYTDARHTPTRGRFRQAILNLFLEAKAGDYVVLPEPVYQGNIHVGRISSDSITIGSYSRRYAKIPIPARDIRWLVEVPENTVSAGLSKSLRHQLPFSLLDKSLYVEALSLVHGSFVFGDRHTATIYNSKSDFLDSDAALLGAISRLAAAACRAVDQGTSSLSTIDLVDVLLRTPPIQYTCSQSADIHSPGFNRYVSGSIAALVIAALTATFIALGEKSSKSNLPSDINTFVVMNSAPGADPQCAARVSQAAALVLQALGVDRTWELCEAAKAAAGRAGLKSSAAPTRPPASGQKR